MKRNKEEDRSETTGLICSLSIRWARRRLGPHLESQNRGPGHGDISSLTWNQRSGHSPKNRAKPGPGTNAHLLLGALSIQPRCPDVLEEQMWLTATINWFNGNWAWLINRGRGQGRVKQGPLFLRKLLHK